MHSLEKLQAIPGPWSDLVRKIINDFITSEDGVAANLDLDRTRSRDYQNICHTIFSISHLPALTQATPTQVEKWLGNPDGPTPLMREKVVKTFRIYRDIAKDKKLKVPLTRPSRVAPVEFVVIGILIAKFMDQRSPFELSKAINILRSEVRSQHADIRNNSKVFKTMCKVLTDQIPLAWSQETPGLSPPAELTKPSIKNVLEKQGKIAGSGKRSSEDMDIDSEDDQGLKRAKQRLGSSMRSPMGHLQRSQTTRSPASPRV